MQGDLLSLTPALANSGLRLQLVGGASLVAHHPPRQLGVSRRAYVEAEALAGNGRDPLGRSRAVLTGAEDVTRGTPEPSPLDRFGDQARRSSTARSSASVVAS